LIVYGSTGDDGEVNEEDDAEGDANKGPGFVEGLAEGFGVGDALEGFRVEIGGRGGGGSDLGGGIVRGGKVMDGRAYCSVTEKSKLAR
jgi:hypothetical protein